MLLADDNGDIRTKYLPPGGSRVKIEHDAFLFVPNLGRSNVSLA